MSSRARDTGSSRARNLRAQHDGAPADVPNAGAGLKTLPEKEKWNRAFEAYLRDLDAKKPVIWCGDMNVVATPLGEPFLLVHRSRPELPT